MKKIKKGNPRPKASGRKAPKALPFRIPRGWTKLKPGMQMRVGDKIRWPKVSSKWEVVKGLAGFLVTDQLGEDGFPIHVVIREVPSAKRRRAPK